MVLKTIQTYKIWSKSNLTHLTMIYHDYEDYPKTHLDDCLLLVLTTVDDECFTFMINTIVLFYK